MAHEDQGDDKRAVEFYERAIAAAPEEPDAHFNVSRVYERLGHKFLALKSLKEYNPDSTWTEAK